MSTQPRVLVTLSAYACEGGFDGRHQPATCFTPTIALGRHAGPGDGEGLWSRYEEVVDAASDAGLAGICLEISWARLEPRRGQRDEAALARYVEVITRARERGLFVGVAAVDAAWPAWLGLEAWLLPWVVPVTVDYVAWVASSLPADSVSVFAAGERMTRGFLDASAGPPWRRNARADARSAQQNLEDIETAARAASARVVSSVAVELDDVGDVASFNVDEVHVRSLVRGLGPLRSASAVLARRGTQWVLTSGELSPALRRATP